MDTINAKMYQIANEDEKRHLNGSAVYGWVGYPRPLDRFQHAFRTSINQAPDLEKQSQEEAETAALDWLRTAVRSCPTGMQKYAEKVKREFFTPTPDNTGAQETTR